MVTYYIYRAVFVEEGMIHQDEIPEHILGDPKALLPKIGVYAQAIVFLNFCYDTIVER